MEPCSSTNCILLQKRRKFNTSTVLIGTQPDTNNSNDSGVFFSIVLPIVLVVGVFVVVGVGLVIHRLILRYVRKVWQSRSSAAGTVSDGIEGGYTRSAGVNTISGNFADLPTYRQVIETIQKEEMPPPYQDITGGVANLGFTGDAMLQIVDETSIPTSGHENRCSKEYCDKNIEQVSSVNKPSKLVLPTDSNAMASFCYKYRLPPIDLPEDKAKQEIDEVINSISVPSILPNITIQNNHTGTKRKRISLKSRSPKDLTTKPSSTNMPEKNVTVILRSTPI